MYKYIFVSLAMMGLSGCGGGPGKSELQRACMDGGAKAFGSRRPTNETCGCIVKQVKRDFKKAADQTAILEHWNGQRQKTFGTSLFPSSVMYSEDAPATHYTLSCELDFKR